MTAGPDGLRGLGSKHWGALRYAMTYRGCPNPGPDHFAVAAFCSLPVTGRTTCPARTYLNLDLS
ncbi:MAG: hypothetical protein ACLQIQ_05420, partial [Beijerinckiaceae bacterium]